MTTAPTLQFLGAAGTVTGSRYLVDTGGVKVLVDAGMFQGDRALRERNFAPFPVPASEIAAIVLTHGHFDHAGYIPKLVKDGFRGPVFGTEWTGRIAELVLMDSGKIQELEAKRAARSGRKPLRPALYNTVDAARAVLQFRQVPGGTDFPVAPGITGHLRPAGHILGSASVELKLEESGRTVVFSGDLGRNNHPILLPPVAPPDCDAMVVESTYGDREHQDETQALQRLASAVRNTIARGGTVVIPSFAVDRTEVVLRQLGDLMVNGAIPKTPIYVDGKMAVGVLHLYRQAMAKGLPEIRPFAVGQDFFNQAGQLHIVKSPEQREQLRRTNGVIIVASSGMVSGGAVVGHLVSRIADPRNTVVLSGYQGAGTSGRKLAEGSHKVWLDGRQLDVGAQIVSVGFSAHADSPELLKWLGSGKAGVTYAVHGEPRQSEALARKVRTSLKRRSVVPAYQQKVEIGRGHGPVQVQTGVS